MSNRFVLKKKKKSFKKKIYIYIECNLTLAKIQSYIEL